MALPLELHLCFFINFLVISDRQLHHIKCKRANTSFLFIVGSWLIMTAQELLNFEHPRTFAVKVHLSISKLCDMADLVRLYERCLCILEFMAWNVACCKLLLGNLIEVQEHHLEKLRRVAFRYVLALLFKLLNEGVTRVLRLWHWVKNWQFQFTLILALIPAFFKN